jgi:dihydrofolate synthase/folylpolyglutamate synthase
MKYSCLLQQLYSRTAGKGIKLGLENTLRLNKALGCPDLEFKSIHVAGTNGKGSVCTKIAKALQYEGLRVGLYTSPHISTFRERIQINGQMISEEAMIDLLQTLFFLADNENIPATFFEITTCLALKYFSDQKVDFAVLETGLGGRFDATNIVTPLLSIITSISLDHVDILGNSIEAITLEKAGIIKPKVPIIIGPRVPFSIIKNNADRLQSPCIRLASHYDLFDDENSAIAKKALELLKTHPEAIEDGLKALPPCRLQIYQAADLKKCKLSKLPAYVILDVAHNPDGLQHLFTAIKTKLNPKKTRVLCCFSKNKDLKACLQLISQYADFVEITQAANPRAAPIEDIKLITDGLSGSYMRFNFHTNADQCIKKALHKAHENNEILVICGTFFIMSQARDILGVANPLDPLPVGEFI